MYQNTFEINQLRTFSALNLSSHCSNERIHFTSILYIPNLQSSNFSMIEKYKIFKKKFGNEESDHFIPPLFLPTDLLIFFIF